MSTLAQKLRWKHGIKLPSWDQCFAAVAGVAFGIFLLFWSFGCQAGGMSQWAKDYKGNAKIETQVEPQSNGATRIVQTITTGGEQTTKSEAKLKAPDEAREGSSMTTNDEGTTVSTGGQWQPAVVTVIQRHGGMFYIASIILAVVIAIILFVPAVRAFIPGAGGLCIGLGGVAAICAVAPSGIERFGWQLFAGALIVFVVFAVTWVLMGAKKNAEKRKQTDQLTTDLVAKGQTEAAVVARAAMSDTYKTEAQRKGIIVTETPLTDSAGKVVGSVKPAGDK
jgi:hypothetical protein